jgi:chemotaxis signal transduction protein
MNVSTAPSTPAPATSENRYILVQISDQTLAIPARWVAEILRVDKIKILSLPFYDNLVMGVTHHHGKVLPLLSTHLLLGQPSVDLREMSTVVRLGAITGDIVEVGLIVDQLMRSVIQSELPTTVIVFDPQMMQLHLWQPLR